jgi:hypothetical protein
MSGTAVDTAYQARHRILSDAEILAIDEQIIAVANAIHAAGGHPTIEAVRKVIHRSPRIITRRVEYLEEQGRWPYVRHTRSSPRLTGGRKPKADPKPKRTINLDKMPLGELYRHVRHLHVKDAGRLRKMAAQS